jgi:hypothetical protein
MFLYLAEFDSVDPLRLILEQATAMRVPISGGTRSC